MRTFRKAFTQPARRRQSSRYFLPWLGGFSKRECGSVAIETAISFLLLMTFVLGIIESSMMVYLYSVFGDAARQGVRYATVHGSDSNMCSGPSSGCGDPSATNVVNYIAAYASHFSSSISGMTIRVTYPDGSSMTPSRVLVTITYTYKPLFNFPGASQVFQTTSEGRILY